MNIKYPLVLPEVVSIVNYSSEIRDLPTNLENKKIIITSDFHFNSENY